MYQVIKMFGDWEPWWFIEDWEEDIIEEEIFERFTDAFAHYQEQWNNLKENFSSFKSQQNLLAAFWDIEEQRWCEECDEYLQQYHSILLLKDGEVLPKELAQSTFDVFNANPKFPSSCLLKR